MTEHFPVGDPAYDAPDIQTWLNDLPEMAKRLARYIPVGSHIEHGITYVVTGYTTGGDCILVTPLSLILDIGGDKATEFQVRLSANRFRYEPVGNA